MLGTAWRSARPWDLFLSRGPFTLYWGWILKGTAFIKGSPQGPRLQGLLTVHSSQPLELQRPRTLPSWNQAEALDKELPPSQEAEPSAPHLQLAGGLSSSP